MALQGQADPLKASIPFIKKLLSSALMNFCVKMYCDAHDFWAIYLACCLIVALHWWQLPTLNHQVYTKNGIHRDRFLPAIAQVEKHTTVMNIDAGIDYRLRLLKQAKLYSSLPDR